ncbi:hypothetical protein KAR91_03125, partial [Candidatus Pacearchaeota archaeon]|nr:hypothetical protein [Candidatus Pacearchaeota archaeon]
MAKAKPKLKPHRTTRNSSRRGDVHIKAERHHDLCDASVTAPHIGEGRLFDSFFAMEKHFMEFKEFMKESDKDRFERMEKEFDRGFARTRKLNAVFAISVIVISVGLLGFGVWAIVML